jgi:hypothetical protein
MSQFFIDLDRVLDIFPMSLWRISGVLTLGRMIFSRFLLFEDEIEV